MPNPFLTYGEIRKLYDDCQATMQAFRQGIKPRNVCASEADYGKFVAFVKLMERILSVYDHSPTQTEANLFRDINEAVKAKLKELAKLREKQGKGIVPLANKHTSMPEAGLAGQGCEAKPTIMEIREKIKQDEERWNS